MFYQFPANIVINKLVKLWLAGVGRNFEDKLRQTFNYKAVNRVLPCHVAVNSE